MSEEKIKGTPAEMNRTTAKSITSSHYGVEQTAATFKLENDVFSALQIAQKRGEVLTSFRQDVALEAELKHWNGRKERVQILAFLAAVRDRQKAGDGNFRTTTTVNNSNSKE